MTKPGKVYKDPDAWVTRIGCTFSLILFLIGVGLLGLIVWGLVELIQLIGRLG